MVNISMHRLIHKCKSQYCIVIFTNPKGGWLLEKAAHPWKCSNPTWMWHLGTKFGGGAGFMLGLEGLRGFFHCGMELHLEYCAHFWPLDK